MVRAKQQGMLWPTDGFTSDASHDIPRTDQCINCVAIHAPSDYLLVPKRVCGIIHHVNIHRCLLHAVYLFDQDFAYDSFGNSVH
jgi:hypothetical protein